MPTLPNCRRGCIIIDAARAGCHIATIPYNVLIQMAKHPLTDIGIERFLKDWESVPKK